MQYLQNQQAETARSFAAYRNSSLSGTVIQRRHHWTLSRIKERQSLCLDSGRSLFKENLPHMYEVSTILFREMDGIILGWPQTELAPASWQPCSLARVGHFGGVLRLRSSAWDRPRTPSRTSAAAGLAWLVGRFAGAHRGEAMYHYKLRSD